MKHTILVALAAIMVIASLSSCSSVSTGAVVTDKKDFSDFADVAVAGPFEVEIVQSELYSVTTTNDANLTDYVTVTKEGNVISISLKPRNVFTDFTLSSKPFTAKVSLPVLHSLRLSGASKGTLSEFKSSQPLSLDISGASSLKIDNIEVGDADFKVSGASTVTGKILTNNCKFDVSGASKIELSGSAKDVTLSASGAGKINLDDFPLNNANVTQSGASEISIKVKETLGAALSDASTLYFQGNPTMGNMTVSGASTIKHK